MPCEKRTVNFEDLRYAVGYKFKYNQYAFKWVLENFSIPCDNIKDVLYSTKRNQSNKLKRQTQSVYGKLGEYCVSDALRLIGCTNPNIEVLDKPTFKEDLICSKFKIHVKTCPPFGDHGVSFTFQKSNLIGGGVDDLFKTNVGNNNIIACCKVVEENKPYLHDGCIQIVGIFKWEDVLPILAFRDGFDYPHLKNGKLFLHEDSLISLIKKYKYFN
jgi:hypothetical protein